jgi:hypothetical protein
MGYATNTCYCRSCLTPDTWWGKLAARLTPGLLYPTPPLPSDKTSRLAVFLLNFCSQNIQRSFPLSPCYRCQNQLHALLPNSTYFLNCKVLMVQVDFKCRTTVERVSVFLESVHSRRWNFHRPYETNLNGIHTWQLRLHNPHKLLIAHSGNPERCGG